MENLFSTLVKLRDAILTAHAGKYRTLDVRHHGNFATWDCLKDTGWQKYRKARDLLYTYPLLEKIFPITIQNSSMKEV